MTMHFMRGNMLHIALFVSNVLLDENYLFLLL